MAIREIITDGLGFTGSAVLLPTNGFLSGEDLNSPPAWLEDPIDGGSVRAGEIYRLYVGDLAEDPDDDPLTFSKVSGPNWVTVDADGTLWGRPTPLDVAAPATIVVRANDGAGGTADADVEIIVEDEDSNMSCSCHRGDRDSIPFIGVTGEQSIIDPGTDKRVVIDRVICTAEAAETFHVKHGSTVVHTINVGAFETPDEDDLDIKLPYEAEALLVMPSADTPAARVYYHVESRL